MTDLDDSQPITPQEKRWSKWIVCVCLIALVPLVVTACKHHSEVWPDSTYQPMPVGTNAFIVKP